MARHPTRPRGSRGADQPDDAFIATIDRVVAWTRANLTAVIIGAVALVLIVGGLLYYRYEQNRLEDQAAVRFTELQGTLASGNTQLAIRDLQSFVNRFGGTAHGQQARIALADLLLAEGQPEPALDALGNLPRNPDRPLGAPAARLQAAAYEAMDQPDRAVEIYERIADEARFPFQRREALADAARVRLQADDPEAAADLYARLVSTFEEGEAGRGYYEMWLAEARALAARAGREPAAEQAPTGQPAPAEQETGAEPGEQNQG